VEKANRDDYKLLSLLYGNVGIFPTNEDNEFTQKYNN
jgi:hypothetical protein